MKDSEYTTKQGSFHHMGKEWAHKTHNKDLYSFQYTAAFFMFEMTVPVLSVQTTF